MKLNRLVLLFVVLAGCKPGPMSERAFTAKYVERLTKAHPDAQYQIKNDLAVTAKYKGKEFSHFLNNAYNEYQRQPDSLDYVLDKFVGSSSDLYMEEQPIKIENIIPVIKPAVYLEDLKKVAQEVGQEKAPSIVYESYNSELIVVYAENTERSVRYFEDGDFNKLNIPRDSLLHMAVRNLKRILPEIQSRGANGTYMITAGGDFEASLILMTHLWLDGNFKIKGDLVAAIPSRDVLVVTGSDDEQGLKMTKQITDDTFSHGNYQVSSHLFKWNGKKFEVWK